MRKTTEFQVSSYVNFDPATHRQGLVAPTLAQLDSSSGQALGKIFQQCLGGQVMERSKGRKVCSALTECHHSSGRHIISPGQDQISESFSGLARTSRHTHTSKDGKVQKNVQKKVYQYTGFGRVREYVMYI